MELLSVRASALAPAMGYIQRYKPGPILSPAMNFPTRESRLGIPVGKLKLCPQVFGMPDYKSAYVCNIRSKSRTQQKVGQVSGRPDCFFLPSDDADWDCTVAQSPVQLVRPISLQAA